MFSPSALFGRSFTMLIVFLLAAATCVFAQAAPTAPAAEATNPAFANERRLLLQGKFADALAELETLQKQDPQMKGLNHEFGVAYYKKGDYLNAITTLEKAQSEDPADGEATQLLGLSLYLGGKPAAAIPYLEKVQTWFPRANIDASYILGVCYVQTKKYDEARGAFSKMFGIAPESAAGYLVTARMLLRLDFAPIAEEYGQKAIALDAKLPLAHLLLGEVYLFQSKIPEAISQLEQELTINPGYAVVYYKLADAEMRLQKFDEAERLLQRSIWLDQTSTGPFILMGKVLQKKGETELAVRALQRAVAMDPNNPMPHQLLGQAYRTLGQASDAERELKQAEELQPRSSAKP